MAKPYDFSARQHCVCFALRRAARVVTQSFDAEMRRQGIRSTQGTVLSALLVTGPASMAVLSEGLAMERTTLLRNLRPLQRDGLVAIEEGASGSAREISLTPKGKAQIEKLAPAWNAAQQRVVKVLGEARWTQMLADLDQVATALRE